jgi:hypothetical protein
MSGDSTTVASLMEGYEKCPSPSACWLLPTSGACEYGTDGVPLVEMWQGTCNDAGDKDLNGKRGFLKRQRYVHRRRHVVERGRLTLAGQTPI